MEPRMLRAEEFRLDMGMDPRMLRAEEFRLDMGKEPHMLWAEELIIEWGRKLRTDKLFANTTYGVFLVFKLAQRHSGLESATATVTNGRVYDEASCTVYLTFGRERRNWNQEVPRIRDNEWMEVKMGEFNTGEGFDREVVARLMQHSDFEKSGLIVLGIEFQPLD
ncbi:hypothetical protein RJ639_008174 [Escallonia herrerae]|uniref:Uncharacterized protein n=1 Tax=Escallonia herrerae TaxID=1293975 RepID=A0AA88VUK8_9ASTE|nr:hypothetical protein RJ639_008174 [Escallonia herrerae]